ncbi:hypothetical protein IAD21_02115 [Abditibacteriota bacterium]|nr:hypothetical protein IAD21_02115 [Abditibacteriota bacterium]
MSSSEELSQGIKYKQKWDAPRYPLTRLFDGDTKTAWVYSATSREFFADYWKSRYGLRLEPDKPITLDAIRIVNGQNASPSRFKANHRANIIKITLSDGKTRHIHLRQLADKQGWQTVKFPRVQAKAITLEFPQLARSQSKGADFCLSEIELRNGGRKISWDMPQLVMYYNGLEGDADAPLLIRRDGFPLDGIAMDAGYTDDWSPSGRYVSGVAGAQDRLWIYDALQGAKISKASPARMSPPDQKWLRRLPKSNMG